MVVASTLVFAGCTGDPEPEPTPATPTPAETVEPSPTPTPTPSPSTTALTDEEIIAALPPDARAENFGGAQAFATYFLENYIVLLEDQPTVFTGLTVVGCTFCESVERYYRDASKAGEVVEGGSVSVVSEQASGGLDQATGRWTVTVDVEVAPLARYTADGEEVGTSDGGPGRSTLELVFDEHWSVVDVGSEAATS
ncbi:DUF6318 family protein [uncultured Demequina sp.]|uniref:DUF6318 family protein n=1 Tax=uncultured Demequina sp. TaxID=693499 RepID=UPI0025E4B05A|nr:DUF6318 family protein [uncultured Demequina sp.]